VPQHLALAGSQVGGNLEDCVALGHPVEALQLAQDVHSEAPAAGAEFDDARRRVRQHLGPGGEALAGLLDELEQRRYGRGADTTPSREWLRRLDATARRLAGRRASATNSTA
jgi:hypothetical protein